MSRISSFVALALLTFASSSSAAPVSQGLDALTVLTPPDQIRLNAPIEFAGNPTQGQPTDCAFTGSDGETFDAEASTASDSVSCTIPNLRQLIGQTTVQLVVSGGGSPLSQPATITVNDDSQQNSNWAASNLVVQTPPDQIALNKPIAFAGNPSNGNNVDVAFTGSDGETFQVPGDISSDAITAVIPNLRQLLGQTQAEIRIAQSGTTLAGPVTINVLDS